MAKSFLDKAGLTYFWKKIKAEDYSTNQTLTAVINAVDETKQDKITGTSEQVAGFDAEGKMTAVDKNDLAVVGPAGKDAPKVTGVKLNEDSTITFTLDNDTELTTVNAIPPFNNNGITTVGSDVQLVWLRDNLLVSSSATVGAPDRLVFLNGGVVTASAANVGAEAIPVYLKNGQFVAANQGNDYAEARNCEIAKPGRVVVENASGIMRLAHERLESAAAIISDTYGSLLQEQNGIPVAVAGRVLAYPLEPREEFKLGDAVCSGPDGTVSIMTRDEIQWFPERIIGIVSEIPNYETWGKNNINVDGRIWIKIK